MNYDNFTGLILAAGRGSRLLSLTDDRPKGLVKLAGRSLVDWQSSTMRSCGLKQIHVVNGYLGHMFDELGFETITNDKWDTTNMVGSLMCAIERLEGPFLISYSDIVYHPSIIHGLLACKGDFVISYDKDWLQLWSDRFDDPLSDAESFKTDKDNTVIEIGRKVTDVDEIQGQFMGLLKVSHEGVRWIIELLNENVGYRSSLDTTKMLSLLLGKGRRITGHEISGNWCEIDDQTDLKVAESYLTSGKLSLVSEGDL